ncbi:MAG: hypothetical protein J3T61_11850, partial [Candidatus Brocadiales bacterium]|nr:hypothetical protein [Candidatus Bathyanammoxibius sp.]
MKTFFHLAVCLRPMIAVVGLLCLSIQSLCARACPELAEGASPESASWRIEGEGLDSTGVTLSLPHLTIPADTDTVVVPVELRNEWDEVGGLQVDISVGDVGPLGVAQRTSPTLDTILTTDRTSGWMIDRSNLPRPGTTRILLFDPAGSNIAAGAGPVMELVLSFPEEGVIPDFVPLRMEAVVVSDPVGGALPARGGDGSLTLGEMVELKAGEAETDQGDTVSLAVDMFNAGPVVGVQFGLAWESNLLELVRATT